MSTSVHHHNHTVKHILDHLLCNAATLAISFRHTYIFLNVGLGGEFDFYHLND